MEVLRLFPAVQQFQVKNGAINTDGRLYVYFNGTDDLADCFDVDGSRIAQPVILDNNGRAPGLFVDASKVYRLEVQDRYGNLLFTVRNMVPTGGGAGSALGKDYDVVSLDGSIAVDKSVDAGNTTFDLSIAPSDSVEFLEWGAAMRGNMHEGGVKAATLTSGTMEMGERGPKLLKDHYYHITNWMTVIPSGTGRNYETLTVTLHVTDGTGWHSILIRDFDIDTSVSDSVTHEFSLDFLATEDCEIFWELSNNVPDIGVVDYLGMNVHRIYSGINAVPGTCATKQWVSESFQPLSGMSSYVPYSAVGNNTVGQVTGINGSAIAGSIDSATVSSIASSVASAYTESAFSSISSWTADLSSISSKADQSALTAYQPVSAMSGYATEAYVDAAVGDKLDATASSLFLTSLPDDLATTGDVASAVSGKLDKSASGEFYPMTGNPSGFLTAHQSLAGYATEQYVDSAVSSKLDTSAFASASGNFQPTGDYAYNSSLSAYIPTSASGAFQPSGDYAFNSSLSSKMDVTASSLFVQNSAYTAYTANMGDVVNNISSSITSLSSDVTGKQDASAMTAWIPYSALDYSGTAISGIGGSSLAGMGGGGDYTGVYPVNVDNTAREISVDSLPLVTDSSMTAYGSAGSSVIGVNMDIMSGKLDSSAQVVTATATRFYPYAGMDFLTSVNGAPVSASRAGNAANASLANSAWYDGTGRFISALPDSATVSAIASAYTTGKQDTLTFSYDDDKISAINGSALAGQGGATGDYVEKSSMGVTIGSNITAGSTAFAQGSANSSIGRSFAQGDGNTAGFFSFAQGGVNNVSGSSFAQGSANIANGTAFAQGISNIAVGNSLAQGLENTARSVSFAQGIRNSAINTATVFGMYNLHGDGSTSTGNSAAFVIGDGTANNARHDLMLVTKDGEITMFSSTADTVGTGIMSSIRAISAAATGGTQVVTATGSANFNGTGINTINGSSIIARSLSAGSIMIGSSDPGMYLTGGSNGGTAYYKSNELVINRSGYGETIKFNLGSAGSQIYGSAAGTRGAFMQMNNDSHTAFFGAASGGDAKIELDGYSAGSANMAGWDSTWNTVSNQSANWGGSALALSAGPGVTLTKSGNTLIAGLDETVLWSGPFSSTTTTAATYPLSENIRNFEKFKVVVSPNDQSLSQFQRPLQEFVFNLENNSYNAAIYAHCPTYSIGGNVLTINYWYITGSTGSCTSLALLPGVIQTNSTVTTGVTAYAGGIAKIIGINRTAGV